MIHQTIALNSRREVTLTTFFLENSVELHPSIQRPVIIVCPGGGYSFLSDRESEIIALQFNAAGFHSAVLRYGINEYAVMPGPICDLADAVALLRDNASQWYIDENQIFVCGFSAGAHVAAGLSVFWNRGDVLKKYQNDSKHIRPNGTILGYPVIDLHSSSSHLDIGIEKGTPIDKISFGQIHPNMPLEKIFVFDEKESRYFVDFETAMNAYLFGGEYSAKQEDFYSLQNQISKDTPPAFLWHGGQDGLIYPRNSLLYAEKLSQLHIPYELHIFGSGDHGLSLANHITGNCAEQISPICEPWLSMAIRWINSQSKFDEKIFPR
ncbi:MAG: alpha/beta hydrolase [Lachnospiraceae bacterium]